MSPPGGPSPRRLLFLLPPSDPSASRSAASRAMSARTIQKATRSLRLPSPSLPSPPPDADGILSGGPSARTARPRGLSLSALAGSNARSESRAGPMTSPAAMGRDATTRRDPPAPSSTTAMLHGGTAAEDPGSPPRGEGSTRRRDMRSSARRLMLGSGGRQVERELGGGHCTLHTRPSSPGGSTKRLWRES